MHVLSDTLSDRICQIFFFQQGFAMDDLIAAEYLDRGRAGVKRYPPLHCGCKLSILQLMLLATPY